MDQMGVAFAVLFVLIPLALLAAIAIAPGTGLLLLIVGLALLTSGFVVALGFVEL